MIWSLGGLLTEKVRKGGCLHRLIRGRMGTVNGSSVKVIGTAVTVCAALGVYGWISVTGGETNVERYLQMLILLAPTIAGLAGLKLAHQAAEVAQETKEIVTPNTEDTAKRAQAAYSAYGDSVGWVNFQGEKMPPFSALSLKQQAAWYAAARAGNGENVR